MKHVVSVSLGSSSRNHRHEIEFLGERVLIERVGTEGDMARAARLLRELDGQVDAIGLGGISLTVRTAWQTYRVRDAERLVRDVVQTPVTDGVALKESWERWLITDFLPREKGIAFRGKRVLFVSSVDRYAMTEAFLDARADFVAGDLMFALGLPIPLRWPFLGNLLAAVALPILTRVSFGSIYPIGKEQEQITPRFGRYYAWAEVIAGDFHFIRRYMPPDLRGKIIITQTVTAADVDELRRRGVWVLVADFPDMGGRSFATNVLQGVIVAVTGRRPDEISGREYVEILQQAGMTPRVEELTPRAAPVPVGADAVSVTPKVSRRPWPEVNNPETYRPTVYDTIRAVDRDRWDAVPGDPFSAYDVLRALEESALPGIRMWYAVLEDSSGRWQAAAPFATVRIDAARLTRGLFRAGIEGARRAWPAFMQTTLAVCGTPLSVGNPPVRFGPDADRAAVLSQCAHLLDEFADASRAPWRAFKEFPAAELSFAREVLVPRGWILAPSEPNFGLPLVWPSYDRYLASLRSDYRYKIRKAARKMEQAGVAVDVVGLSDGYSTEIHALYDAVADRAAVQLEHLTPAFFVGLGRARGDAAQLIRFTRNGSVIGWVVMLFDGDVAFDMFHGIDYSESGLSDIYFNQLAEVIRVAIEHRANGRRVRYLSLGQSTEIAKSRFGGRAVPLWVALRHRDPALTAILRAGGRHFFPERAQPVRHVFREEPEPAR